MLNAEEYRRRSFSLPMLYDTPYGAAYRRAPGTNEPTGFYIGGMTHVDKVLSTLGELGIGLTAELVTEACTHRVLSDVLEDSLKRWHPERESEWTLVAYCSYLQLQRTWISADGREWSVDDVLGTVMRATRSPCFGTHRLYGIARACMRARQTPGFFTQGLVAEAEHYLQKVSAELALTQLGDGSWRPPVADDSTPRGTPDFDDHDLRLQVTGHLLEWFAVADSDLRPPSSTVEKAAHYIKRELLRYSTHTSFKSHLLPAVTHAIRGLCNVRDHRVLCEGVIR